MTILTKKMLEVLKSADLVSGEINNVPISTMYGLENRKLVMSEWHSRNVATTAGGTFPMYNRVRLTPTGLHAARTAQGLEETSNNKKQ